MLPILRTLGVVLCVSVSSIYAWAGEWGQHPWFKDYAPLPVGGEYTPPEWLNTCPALVAGAEVGTATSCLPPIVGAKTDTSFVFDETRWNELDRINRQVNSAVGQDQVVTLEEAIAAAVEKKRLAADAGFPIFLLAYAVVEAPLEASDDAINDTEHFVLLLMFNTRAFALDTLLDDILPWQYSPCRMYGIEINGQWRAVADDRDDPRAIALELYE